MEINKTVLRLIAVRADRSIYEGLFRFRSLLLLPRTVVTDVLECRSNISTSPSAALPTTCSLPFQKTSANRYQCS